MTEDFVIKYFWSVLGYGLMSIPVFFPVARHVMQHDPSTTKADVHVEVAARTESQ
jgi:ATP-binding cassette subfamily D (ALD) long-chain fatty acid import protein